MKKDADGGLTLYIQSTSPGKDKEANWLPSPQSGPFFLIMRTYMPGAEIVEQKWALPPVVATARGATKFSTPNARSRLSTANASIRLREPRATLSNGQ